MDDKSRLTERVIWFLQERAKELNCLYKIEELLSRPETSLDGVCQGVIRAIPPGWQYPDFCVVRIVLQGETYVSPGFEETPWVQSADIEVQDERVGCISVYYTKDMPPADDGPFLQEETKLLATIADRFGHYLMYNRMKQVFHEYQVVGERLSEHRSDEWRVALNLLRHTDHNLFLGISRRMLNFLCWSGIAEAEDLMSKSLAGSSLGACDMIDGDNRPYQRNGLVFSDDLGDQVFEIAARQLPNDQILSKIQQWMQEERLGFLLQVVDQNVSLPKVVDAIRRYHHMTPRKAELAPESRRGILVSLTRRFLSDQQAYINTARQFVDIGDFYDILDHIVFAPHSQGRLGGKSAGLFLAEHIVRKSADGSEVLKEIKVPRTWYITSDTLLAFIEYNNLNEVLEQKYKDVNQVRLEYPHLIQTFKNATFPQEIIQGLSMVLDDFKDRPLIVRSSSLLEDRAGAAFSGKYKSLFLPNQGSKRERLDALTDAVAEVYASVFGPDPIGYRAERGMLDFSEQMGIMIQEVVGTRIGDYFIPSFAGVAFSRNEFRWSPRIKPEDGLLRLVPGLGTRAVDRTSDDYPVLMAPGQTGLRVNVTVDETVRYAPKMMDVINLRTNTFETVEVKEVLRNFGSNIPGIEKIISSYDDEQIRTPVGKNIDFEKEDLVVTFEGLFTRTDFVSKVKALLELLEQKMGTPVDIEFASDGTDFYLLQCRPQSFAEGCAPAPIPRDIENDRIVFSARRYVSNGKVPEISHVVFVDPEIYDRLPDHQSMLAVARAVGKLNKLLPKRRFILMGPGRWGSRGDIKLGVKVTYADISNTAVLIEIARQRGNYLPDLSFGTHFFQDLVEAQIRYLPLYPDDDGTILNEHFLRGAKNILPEVLPECAHLADTLKVIDVPGSTDGLHLRVLMNADLDEAVGYLAEASSEVAPALVSPTVDQERSANFWAWRMRMSEHIASKLDPDRFGVKGLYIFGSTKNATAGPASDIDLLIHFGGTDKQREDLLLWLNGWSLALDEMNYLRTGYRSGGLLDIHIVTDEDIARKNSYAIKIGAVTDPARPLAMMKKSPRSKSAGG